MNKHILMLSAVALSLPAGAALATDYSTAQTSALSTSSVGDIHLLSGGAINVKLGSAAATLNSNNSVILDSESSISNSDISSAIGIFADAATNPVGSIINNGAISLAPSGTGKTAILVGGAGTFTGPITLGSTSSISVTGDGSTIIGIASGATMVGSISVAGTMTATSSSSSSSENSNLSLIDIGGTLNGSLLIDTGSTLTTTGTAGRGIVVTNTGSISGTFTNRGTLTMIGLNTTVIANNVFTAPESGSAIVINGNVAGGIINDGPTGPATAMAGATELTTMGTITANGLVTAPVIVIGAGSQTASVTVGPVSAGTYSFFNRGSISAAPLNADTSTVAMQIAGAAGAPTTLSDGFFNSGLLKAEANAGASAANATGLLVDSFASIVGANGLTVSGETVSTTNATLGTLTAGIIGDKGGIATGLHIAANANVPTINVNQGGKLTATIVSQPSATANTAYAIRDLSGSVTAINVNGGTISATATALVNGAQIIRAIDLSANLTGTNIQSLATGTNGANIVGDILFGSGADTLNVVGNSATNASTVTGAISYGAGGGMLSVGNFATVSGAVTSTDGIDVSILNGGTLTLRNVTTQLNTTSVSVANGGAVNVGISTQLATVGSIYSSGNVALTDGANIGVSYNSFIAQSGNYLLIDATTLTVSQDQLIAMNNSLVSPFLYAGSSFCTSGATGGAVNACTGAASRSQLFLNVQAKTAAQLGLQGHAAQFYTQAVAALNNDPALGAAIVGAVASNADAQTIFDQFAPDVSGGTRAVAIAITDQATGPVAARQRVLREYGNKDGGATLWAQEFALFIKDQGRNDKPGFKDSGWGLAVGLDMGSPSGGWYGGALSFYTGSVNQGARANTHADTLWYMLSGYTDWRGRRGLFLDTNLSVGYFTVQSDRTFTAGALTRTASSSHNGFMGALGVTAGRIMKFGSTQVTPKVSLDGLWLSEQGYTEANGGAGFNLKVGSTTAKSLRAFAGADIAHDVDLGDVVLHPEIRLGYRYDLLNDPTKVTAEFVSVPGTSFAVTGPDPARGSLVGGASVSFNTGAWSIGVSYDYIMGGSSMVTQVGSLSLLGRI